MEQILAKGDYDAATLPVCLIENLAGGSHEVKAVEAPSMSYLLQGGRSFQLVPQINLI